jgi:hypothetical protein
MLHNSGCNCHKGFSLFPSFDSGKESRQLSAGVTWEPFCLIFQKHSPHPNNVFLCQTYLMHAPVDWGRLIISCVSVSGDCCSEEEGGNRLSVPAALELSWALRASELLCSHTFCSAGRFVSSLSSLQLCVCFLFCCSFELLRKPKLQSDRRTGKAAHEQTWAGKFLLSLFP